MILSNLILRREKTKPTICRTYQKHYTNGLTKNLTLGIVTQSLTRMRHLFKRTKNWYGSYQNLLWYYQVTCINFLLIIKRTIYEQSKFKYQFT